MTSQRPMTCQMWHQCQTKLLKSLHRSSLLIRVQNLRRSKQSLKKNCLRMSIALRRNKNSQRSKLVPKHFLVRNPINLWRKKLRPRSSDLRMMRMLPKHR